MSHNKDRNADQKKPSGSLTSAPAASKVSAATLAASPTKKAKKYNEPQLRGCSCDHAYQDMLYGKRRRVFNPCAKGMKLRCSVCGHELD